MKIFKFNKMKNYKNDPLMWVIWIMMVMVGTGLIVVSAVNDSLFITFIGAVLAVVGITSMIFPEHDKNHDLSKK